MLFGYFATEGTREVTMVNETSTMLSSMERANMKTSKEKSQIPESLTAVNQVLANITSLKLSPSRQTKLVIHSTVFR